jgi:hypothetical protein
MPPQGAAQQAAMQQINIMVANAVQAAVAALQKINKEIVITAP